MAHQALDEDDVAGLTSKSKMVKWLSPEPSGLSVTLNGITWRVALAGSAAS
jgi:hypothetical protein